jgi:hypothetical protein
MGNSMAPPALGFAALTPTYGPEEIGTGHLLPWLNLISRHAAQFAALIAPYERIPGRGVCRSGRLAAIS